MAIKTFTWSPRNGPIAEFDYRSRSVQYGDGYAQNIDDGINPETQTWPLTFTGFNEEIRPIIAFLREHRETRAFLWTNPLGELGVYQMKDLRPQQLDFARMTVTVSFVTAYQAEQI